MEEKRPGCAICGKPVTWGLSASRKVVYGALCQNHLWESWDAEVERLARERRKGWNEGRGWQGKGHEAGV